MLVLAAKISEAVKAIAEQKDPIVVISFLVEESSVCGVSSFPY